MNENTPEGDLTNLDFTTPTTPEKQDFSTLEGKLAAVNEDIKKADRAIELAEKYEDPRLKETALAKKAQALATLAALSVPETGNDEAEKLAAKKALEDSHDFSTGYPI